MFTPRSLLPALAAAATVGVVLAAPATAVSPALSPALSPAAAPPVVEADTPLTVAIATMSPSAIPTRGPVRVTGTVTNDDSVPWENVNVYAIAGRAPLTTTAEVAEAAASDPALDVGGRITTPGTYAEIDRIDPGASATFSLRVPRSELPTEEPGVYWFGVHALGETEEGRVPGADGRARTFLPLVDESGPPVEVSLVVPLRREIRYAADGRIAGVQGWARSLTSGGKLAERVAFGAAAGDRPVSFLLDPAVITAARRLAAGNPGRSLAPTVPEGEPDADDTGAPSPSDSSSADPGTDPGPDPTGSPTSTDDPEDTGSTDATGTPRSPLTDLPSVDLDELGPDAAAAARAASAWLEELRRAIAGQRVLALPYGDLDVPAAAQHAPELVERARDRSSEALAGLVVPTTPALGSPSGWLDAAALDAAAEDTLVLLTDEAVPAEAFPDGVPTVLRHADHRVVLTSAAAATGGPGPGALLDALPLRQRILAEAALRTLPTAGSAETEESEETDGAGAAPEPLVVVPPNSWIPSAGGSFFAGMAPDWVELSFVDDVAGRSAPDLDPETLVYPEEQAIRELDPPLFATAAGLASVGDTLQRLLLRNDRVGDVVTDQALAVTSYASRIHPRVARRTAERSRAWIVERLEAVDIVSPTAVTLSSASGRFSATVNNQLDQPIRVGINAVADPDLVIRGPEFVDVPAEQQVTVLLDATTTRLGQHNVQLVLVDSAGIPLGATDTVPIRSAQVSAVIWLFIGGGAALLFGAIAVRLVRRIRARGRAPHPGAGVEAR